MYLTVTTYMYTYIISGSEFGLLHRASASLDIQASTGVPPQLEAIIPMGYFRSLCRFLPYNQHIAEKWRLLVPRLPEIRIICKVPRGNCCFL